MSGSITRDGWTLVQSTLDDVDTMMDWFPTREDVDVWGGPIFRFPFTTESFREDLYWGKMATFSLHDPDGAFAAFGQVYERIGRINLARLVVNPDYRGRGVGKRLVAMLMEISRGRFRCSEYSLFVFRDNVPAYECYKAMGFTVQDYPDGIPHADVCYYLTRPVV